MQAEAPLVLAPADPVQQPSWQRPLGLLLESIGDGIFGIDLAGHCTFINRAGARLLGHEPQQVLGRNMHQLAQHSHADGRPYPDTDSPIFNAFRHGRACRVDTEVFWRADRTAFAVEYSSHPVMDEGQVRGAVVTFTDITARRRAEEALALAHAGLAQAKAELELRVAECTRIAREVHAEVGGLLAALKADANWLDKRLAEPPGRPPEAVQEMRERMRGKCQNMGRLIGSAAAGVGRLAADLYPGLLDSQGLWAALESQVHEFARAAELELDWDMPAPPSPELPELPRPAAMAVLRIFQEMLSNVGRHAKASRLAVRIAAADGRLRITVEDNGSGASPEAFESPTAGGVPGMRERARQLGGHIAIASEEGHGSAFTLILPLP